jgi:hypothetical protein
MKKIETNTRPPSHSGGKVRVAYYVSVFGPNRTHNYGYFCVFEPRPVLAKNEKERFSFPNWRQKTKTRKRKCRFFVSGRD